MFSCLELIAGFIFHYKYLGYKDSLCIVFINVFIVLCSLRFIYSRKQMVLFRHLKNVFTVIT
jgi:hypothetical protein